jgi:group I intron endonuclease
MAQGIIYLIINKELGHKYVGKTTQMMNKEWQYHIERSKRMSTEPLHKAFRKYGIHNFIIKQIDESNETILEERQQYWIKQYNPEYNNASFEVKEKEEEIKIEEKKKRPPHTFRPEDRGDGKHASIRIQGLNLETGEIREWDNSRDAAEDLTGKRNYNSNILKCAKKGAVCYGYRWCLLENKPLKKAIKAVNRITWREVHFESISDALRKVNNGRGKSCLTKALRSKGRYTWKDHMWFYI